jgi:hypothetical protein
MLKSTSRMIIPLLLLICAAIAQESAAPADTTATSGKLAVASTWPEKSPKDGV